MKVAEIIIQKLNALEATNKILLERVYAIEEKLADNFLLEEYKHDEVGSIDAEIAKLKSELKPKGPMQFDMFDKPKGKKRGKYAKTRDIQLPPSIARELMDDNELARTTKISYASYLDKILKEPNSFEAVITMRNEGKKSKDIAEHMHTLNANSEFTKPSAINNGITVARRFGLTELKDKQYVFTDLFHQSKRG